MQTIPTARSIRLLSGLILFSYAACHFLSHATGLFLLEAMEKAGRGILLAPWHTWGGLLILFGALFLHAGLGLNALWRRRHLRMPTREAWQLGLGLVIPLLLIPHVMNVRAGHAFYGLDDSYYRLVYQYWITNWASGLPRQLALLLAVWVHGCLGLHMWLRFRSWYADYWAYLLCVAILIPVLAMLGIMNAGWNAAMRAALEPGFAAAHGPFRPGSLQAIDSASLAAFWWHLQIAYVILITLVFALRFGRDRVAAKLRSISVDYPPGRTVTVPQGFSILEASRWANIAHTSICGGRARCSTCRVRILKGNEYLPAPGPAELMTLSRIKAGDSVRLACQTRPFGPVSVVPLVPAEPGSPAGLRVSFVEGKELLVTALFADLRDSAQIAAGRLPYDALFIIDRYIQAATGVIRGHGGYVTHVAGDGIMSLFGANGDARAGARSALGSAAALLDAIAALSVELADQLEKPLKLGIGVHSGLSIVGEMALSGNLSIQFLGETGNIAARLEAMTKEFGCAAIVSDAAFEAAGVHYEPNAGSLRAVEIRGQDRALPVVLIANSDNLRTLLQSAPAERG
jgi:adenylate cyclase